MICFYLDILHTFLNYSIISIWRLVSFINDGMVMDQIFQYFSLFKFQTYTESPVLFSVHSFYNDLFFVRWCAEIKKNYRQNAIKFQIEESKYI